MSDVDVLENPGESHKPIPEQHSHIDYTVDGEPCETEERELKDRV